jgi:hypothetical protein
MNVWACVSKWSLIAGLAVVTGCATPRPVLNLAGEGAATVGLAEISLRDYVAITKAQLLARADLVVSDEQQQARDSIRRDVDQALDRRAGLPPKDDASDLIRSLGDESRKAREREAQELEKIAKGSTLDLTTLGQVPSEKLAEAKKGFGILAQELSPKEWITLAAGYAKEIQAGVKQIKSSVKDAKSTK